MNKILMLAAAPIRKNKGQSLSIILLMFLAAMLLYVGLNLLLNTDKFFEKKCDEIGAPDVTLVLSENISADWEDYIESYPSFVSREKADGILLQTTIPYGESGVMTDVILLDKKQIKTPVPYVGKTLLEAENSIYLPNVFNLSAGYKIGDEYELMGFKYEITGFFENANIGNVNQGTVGFIVSDYGAAEEFFSTSIRLKLSFIMLESKEDAINYANYIDDKTYTIAADNANPIIIKRAPYQSNLVANTLSLKIGSMIITAFAIMIVFIVLIMVRFRIVGYIEDHMRDVGVLKACGYTSGQIIGGIITQFISLALTGSVIGIVVSVFALTPTLTDMFAKQNGLIWNANFDLSAVLITLSIIIITVLLTAFWDC